MNTLQVLQTKQSCYKPEFIKKLPSGNVLYRTGRWHANKKGQPAQPGDKFEMFLGHTDGKNVLVGTVLANKLRRKTKDNTNRWSYVVEIEKRIDNGVWHGYTGAGSILF